jgi:hypothetical protein
MEMKQKIAIKTRDAQILFKIKVGTKRNLLDATMFRIAMLYNLAEQRNVYAFIQLMQIHSNIDKLLIYIQDNIKKSKKLIKNRMKYLPDTLPPIQDERRFGFSNPIHFGLIQILQNFDECVSWLILARSSHVFAHQNGFYRLKNSIRKRVFRLLSEIIRINFKDFPRTNFNNFFADDMHYKRAIENYGEVDPQILYNAIHSAVTPSLNPEELNTTTNRLKKMVAGK